MKTFNKIQFALYATNRYFNAEGYFKNNQRKLREGEYTYKYYTWEFNLRVGEKTEHVIIYVCSGEMPVKIGEKMYYFKPNNGDLYCQIFKEVYKENPNNVGY